jgi:histidinol-phosphate phosphatase family protein
VINIKPRAGEYVNSWADFRFLPAVFDWIRLFHAMDYLVIVVTNQRGVARGLTHESDLAEIHRRMCEEMSREGAGIDDVFVCPHEEGVCDCRKPRPGLVLNAQQKWKIDLSRSLLIGDSDSDAELARRCGLRFVRVADGRIQQVTIPGEACLPCR